MKLGEFFQSALAKLILRGIAIIVAALLIFQAGVFVGFHKAGFSYRWGEDYYRTFGGQRKIFKGPQRGEPNEFPAVHGSAGKIIKITLPTIVIEDKDKIEKIIVIKDGTVIRRFRDEIKPTDLKVDDSVVVIGSPNDKSEIEARLIRLMPPPPNFFFDKNTKK